MIGLCICESRILYRHHLTGTESSTEFTINNWLIALWGVLFINMATTQAHALSSIPASPSDTRNDIDNNIKVTMTININWFTFTLLNLKDETLYFLWNTLLCGQRLLCYPYSLYLFTTRHGSTPLFFKVQLDVNTGK